jgi:hypothetical protein
MIEKRFNDLLPLLNNDNKSSQFRELFKGATNLQRIELIAILESFLNVDKTNEEIKQQLFNK